MQKFIDCDVCKKPFEPQRNKFGQPISNTCMSCLIKPSRCDGTTPNKPVDPVQSDPEQETPIRKNCKKKVCKRCKKEFQQSAPNQKICIDCRWKKGHMHKTYSTTQSITPTAEKPKPTTPILPAAPRDGHSLKTLEEIVSTDQPTVETPLDISSMTIEDIKKEIAFSRKFISAVKNLVAEIS